VQAWILPQPRRNGLIFTPQNSVAQVVGNMARTFSPSRIFAGYALHCRDASAATLTCSFFVATSTSSFLEPSCTVPMLSWSHISGVYDSSSGDALLYVNGAQCAAARNPAGPAAVSYFLRSQFLVGAWLEDAPGALG
jgi:hypothetical protein